MGKQRNTKRNSCSDPAFIALYFELGQNQSELARRLGIDRSSAYRRLKKIGKERIDESRRSGMSAMTVSMSVQKVQETQQVAFDSGLNVADTCYQSIIQLNLCNKRLNNFLAIFDKEVQEHHANPENKIKPEHVAILSALTREMRGMAEAGHRIRKDLFNIDSINQFMKATVDIMAEETPDVQTRIYKKLSNYGSGEQIAAIYPAGEQSENRGYEK